AAFLTLAGGCSTAPPPPPPAVRVFPPLGAERARPDLGLVVRARGGRLERVDAQTGGVPVRGSLDAAGTTWRSHWALKPGADYTVTVTAAGRTVTQGRFRTRPARRTLQVAATAPLPGETVGVGMPVILDFDTPVRDKAA